MGRTKKSDFAKVTFGRPGNNGAWSALVNVGTTYQKALDQVGQDKHEFNSSKEGLQSHATGKVVMLNDGITEDCDILILPGIDSN